MNGLRNLLVSIGFRRQAHDRSMPVADRPLAATIALWSLQLRCSATEACVSRAAKLPPVRRQQIRCGPVRCAQGSGRGRGARSR